MLYFQQFLNAQKESDYKFRPDELFVIDYIAVYYYSESPVVQDILGKRGRYVWVCVTTMADKLNISRRTIIRILNRMVENRIIEKETRISCNSEGRKRNRKTYMRFHDDFEINFAVAPEKSEGSE